MSSKTLEKSEQEAKSDQKLEPKMEDELTARDMMAVVTAEIKRRGVAGHHIASMNTFYTIGIKQIITNVFQLDARLHNNLSITDEDKSIDEITYSVTFTDVRLTSPTYNNKLGNVQTMAPNLARMTNSIYGITLSIDAEISATAHYNPGLDKQPLTRTEHIQNYRLSTLPCMVGTEMCTTFGKTKDMLREMQEDPTDPGGYVVINGAEWCMDSLENITNNVFHVVNNKYRDELTRGTFLSKPGDAFENSYQVMLRLHNTGMITVEITTTNMKNLQIPFWIIFRLLGMNTDLEIMENITYDDERMLNTSDEMRSILETSFTRAPKAFVPLIHVTDPISIMDAMVNIVAAHEAANKKRKNVDAAKKNIDVAKYLRSQIMGAFDRYMFPHIGTGADMRITKLRFLGHLINKLIGVNTGIIEQTDRDSYRNKRIHTAGNSFAKVFKTFFNYTVVQQIKKALRDSFSDTSFSQVALTETVMSALRSNQLEHTLSKTITVGTDHITYKHQRITNRMSAQVLHRKNDMNVISTLNIVSNSNIPASKQNERADEMRRVHPSYIGFIDCTQSVDTGEKVGMTKQMACTASISEATSSAVLTKIIQADVDVIPLEDVIPAQARSLTKIFVNGNWVGYCADASRLVRRYRMMRRRGEIHRTTSIVSELLVPEIYFWTDLGRMLRPLTIVYNNLDEIYEYWSSKNSKGSGDSKNSKNSKNVGDSKDSKDSKNSKDSKAPKFRQWTLLTKEIIQQLQDESLTITDLAEMQAIEYISPEEQENILLATSIEEIYAKQGDIEWQFTHCDIPQAVLGFVILAGPAANHSNTFRNTLYTNHRKQSAGWFAYSFPYRYDKNTTFQHYCERPLVSTFSDSLTAPNGQNVIVCISLHGGKHQEDSIVINQASADCGLFNASYFSCEKTSLEEFESFGVPTASTIDLKKTANFGNLENNMARRDTLLRNGDVVIAKIAKKAKSSDSQYTHVDKSIIYRHDEPVRVESSFETSTNLGERVAKVKWRATRHIGNGDKLCLTEDHDVLTTEGWIPIADVTVDHLVATLSPLTLALEWVHPLRTYSYDIAPNDPLIHFASETVDVVSNHQHKHFVSMSGELFKAQKGVGSHTSAERISGGGWTRSTSRPIGMIESPRADTDGFTRCTHRLLDIDMIKTILQQPWLHTYEMARDDLPRNHPDNYIKPGWKITFANRHRLGDLSEWSLGVSNAIIKNAIVETYRRFILDPVFTAPLHALPAIASCGDFYRLLREDDVIRKYVSYDVRGCVVLHVQSPHMHGWLCAAGVPAILKGVYGKYTIHLGHEPYVSELPETICAGDKFKALYCLEVPNHVFMTRRNGKPVWTGNSSRTGNKGIIASVIPRCDMPYTEDGLVPDLFVNCHSIPTRMAINQIIEGLIATVAARTGTIIDQTVFMEPSIEGILKYMEEKLGFKHRGHVRMYDGLTGNWLDTLMWITPTTYQRLEKFVIDDHYAIRKGPTLALTRQPLDGKNNDGGLRVGEMEKDVMHAQGTSAAFFEKFYRHSDAHNIPICERCGYVAIYNAEAHNMYICKNCGDHARISLVPSSWTANLFIQEANAMNVDMQFKL